MLELLRYQRDDGREPFTEWLDTLRDKVAQARIRIRLRQIQAGSFGDCEPLGGGVTELRVHVGAGYRVLFWAIWEIGCNPAMWGRQAFADSRY